MKNLFRKKRLHSLILWLICSFLLGIGHGYTQTPTEDKHRAEYEQKAAEELTK